MAFQFLYRLIIVDSDSPELGMSFLSRSFERHFNERPFLNHTSYLFLTKTTKEQSRRQSNFSSLCRGFIVPKEIQDKETAVKFLESVSQFERIVNDSGFVHLKRLSTEEIVGTSQSSGIIEKYFSLSQENTTCLQDISLAAADMRIGDNLLCLHTLSDAEDLPSQVSTDGRYEKLSTDRSDCRLSFAAPVGVLLSCNHIYNQYLFIDDHVKRFHELFFTLSPDKDAIESNIHRALFLVDKSAFGYYKDLTENGYYNRIIAGNVNQTIAIDSMQGFRQEYDPQVWRLLSETRSA